MVSVILPVYNPAAGWAATVLSESALLASQMPDTRFEFIVVNDGSDNEIYDQEKALITGSQIRMIEYGPNRGKGAALRAGVASATGDLIVYTDIDFPYTQQSIVEVIAALRSGHSDVVIGIKDRDYYSHVPAFRKFASRLLRSFVRIFFRIPTDDFMCGLKAFNARGKEIFLRTRIDRYLFDLDFMVMLAGRRDIRTTTIEVHLRDNIHFRNMNPRMIISELRDLIRIWLSSRQ